MLQAKQAHWNLKGMLFVPLHELFDELAQQLRNHTDEVAERLVQLGGAADGSAQHIATQTQLGPLPSGFVSGTDLTRLLGERTAFCTNLIRQEIEIAIDLGDQDTADLYIQISRDLDKTLWKLRSHTEG